MKQSICILGKKFFSTIMAALVLGTPSAALAGTDLWNGGGGDDIFWRTAANWQAATIPVAGDNLIFTNTVSLATSNNFTAGTSFNSITFAAPAGAFVLSGRNIVLTGGIT